MSSRRLSTVLCAALLALALLLLSPGAAMAAAAPEVTTKRNVEVLRGTVRPDAHSARAAPASSPSPVDAGC